MSKIVYSRIPRTQPLNLSNGKLNAGLVSGSSTSTGFVSSGIYGPTSLGVPHYDIIEIDGIAYEAYSCGCPKMPELNHDPFPVLDHEGHPLCPTSSQYRNATFHPDMNKRETTTLQCGCQYNYWYDEYRGSCHHSPEKCLYEKKNPKPQPKSEMQLLYERLDRLEQRLAALE